MARVRYIGSKARVVDEILEIIGPPRASEAWFVDAFCGTGIVGASAADLGWSVRFNDTLLSAVSMAGARLLGPDSVPFDHFGGYDAARKRINSLPLKKGFIWREYSPASAKHAGVERRYFTEKNAQKIDAARAAVEEWKIEGWINESEALLLVADILAGANSAASIAGTYGCFMREWAAGSLRPLVFRGRQLREETALFEIHTKDVMTVPIAENDVAYFDPPYTKRQYAAYYHILETISHGDEPEVEGKTGLRPWKTKASEFSYKSKALRAITRLLDETAASRIYLSYSSEGHVARADLEETLLHLGDVTFHELAEIGRYRPNRAASDAAATVSEYLVELQKVDVVQGLSG
jgi:adenine-specific DNA-methyltransferase